MGVGRAPDGNQERLHSRGARRKEGNQKIPVLVPCSIKNLYLDDPMPSMHSAQVLGPATSAEDYIKFARTLQLAAQAGSTTRTMKTAAGCRSSSRNR
jgi:hypothetical protein